MPFRFRVVLFNRETRQQEDLPKAGGYGNKDWPPVKMRLISRIQIHNLISDIDNLQLLSLSPYFIGRYMRRDEGRGAGDKPWY
jgi:hypothetical protein